MRQQANPTLVVNRTPVETVQSSAGQLLKAPQVAAYLGCSVAQAYKLMQLGQVPTIRIGRSIRVPQKALTAWVDRNTRPGAGGPAAA